MCIRDSKKKKARAILRTVNVDDAKTIIFNRLRITEPGPGFCHFPSHYSDQHYKQLTNEEKIEKRKRGVLIGYEWRQKGPNEQLDCRVYSLGALEYLNPNMARMKLRLEKRAAALKGQLEQPQPQGDDEVAAKKKARRPRKNKGFVSSWK